MSVEQDIQMKWGGGEKLDDSNFTRMISGHKSMGLLILLDSTAYAPVYGSAHRITPFAMNTEICSKKHHKTRLCSLRCIFLFHV